MNGSTFRFMTKLSVPKISKGAVFNNTSPMSRFWVLGNVTSALPGGTAIVVPAGAASGAGKAWA